MTTFTVRGHAFGQPATMVWRDGKLASDNQQLMTVVQNTFASNEGHLVSTGFVTTRQNHLQNPYISFMLIQEWFDPGFELVNSDVPPIEPLDEEGAVM